MEKINEIIRIDDIVKYYKFDSKLVIGDIPKIVESLSFDNLIVKGFSLANNEEYPNCFQRILYSYKDLILFPYDDNYVSKFSVFCNYKNKFFNLSVDFDEQVVATISDGTEDLEPILMNIENAVKKKIK